MGCCFSTQDENTQHEAQPTTLQNVPATGGEIAAIHTTTSPNKCKGLTQKGEQCQRTPKAGSEYCYQHNEITGSPKKAPSPLKAPSPHSPHRSDRAALEPTAVATEFSASREGKSRVCVRVRGVRGLRIIEQALGELVRDPEVPHKETQRSLTQSF